MVPYRTPGFATHTWKLQVYLLYSSSAHYYLFRKKDNRPPAGNKCVLWRADPIIAEPGPVNYTSWRSLFWVSSFFLVTRVPTEYSYTDGEISSDFAKMLMHGLLPIIKNQCFGSVYKCLNVLIVLCLLFAHINFSSCTVVYLRSKI
jgi:hypothetical protein